MYVIPYKLDGDIIFVPYTSGGINADLLPLISDNLIDDHIHQIENQAVASNNDHGTDEQPAEH